MNGKALKTGSKSEDLQGVYFRRLRGKAGRERKNRIRFLTILYPRFSYQVVSWFRIIDFAIIIRKKHESDRRMSSVCKMHAFFAFKGLGYSGEHSIENICLLFIEKCVYLQRVINKEA